MTNPEKDPSEAETAQLARENRKLLAAKYMGDVATFRADVQLLFRKYPMDPNNQWMYFLIQPKERPGPYVDEPRGHDVVILFKSMIAQTPAGRQWRPYIRIVESEAYDMPYGVEFLTRDVVVDQDGDAQYLVDSVGFDENGIRPAYVPFVRYRGNVLEQVGLEPYVTNIEVSDPEELHPGMVRPFGHYSNLHDRIDALAVAQSIFTAAMTEQPVATSGGNMASS